MALPNAEELRAVLAVSREYGVTHLRIGGLEVRLAPPQPAQVQGIDAAKLLAEINDRSPLPVGDPMEEIRRQLGITTRQAPGGNGADGDVLDQLARGGRLTVNDEPDPTRPQTPTV